ncbi:hypothetical protein GY45DRAFT_142962 [Cubamyces sp. BRFM 1775]|nr:hypothetical protein GY45DRAFT_142962 [Cubamyces sp. BRFM 1775]
MYQSIFAKVAVSTAVVVTIIFCFSLKPSVHRPPQRLALRRQRRQQARYTLILSNDSANESAFIARMPPNSSRPPGIIASPFPAPRCSHSAHKRSHARPGEQESAVDARTHGRTPNLPRHARGVILRQSSHPVPRPRSAFDASDLSRP